MPLKCFDISVCRLPLMELCFAAMGISFALGQTVANDIPPRRGLELVDDMTAATIEGMRATMVRNNGRLGDRA